MSEQAYEIPEYWGRRFVRALRTTDAKQIRFFLGNGKGGRCAMGVYWQDLALDGIVDFGPADIGPRGYDRHHPSQAWMVDDFWDGTPLVRRIIEMNNVEGKSFADIADWLETVLPPLTPVGAEVAREKVLA